MVVCGIDLKPLLLDDADHYSANPGLSRGELPDQVPLKTFSRCLLSVSPPQFTGLDLMTFSPGLLFSIKEAVASTSYSTFIGESYSNVRYVDRTGSTSLALKNFRWHSARSLIFFNSLNTPNF